MLVHSHTSHSALAHVKPQKQRSHVFCDRTLLTNPLNTFTTCIPLHTCIPFHNLYPTCHLGLPQVNLPLCSRPPVPGVLHQPFQTGSCVRAAVHEVLLSSCISFYVICCISLARQGPVYEQQCVGFCWVHASHSMSYAALALPDRALCTSSSECSFVEFCWAPASHSVSYAALALPEGPVYEQQCVGFCWAPASHSMSCCISLARGPCVRAAVRRVLLSSCISFYVICCISLARQGPVYEQQCVGFCWVHASHSMSCCISLVNKQYHAN